MRTIVQLNQQFDRDLHLRLQQRRCCLHSSWQCDIISNDRLPSSI